MMYQLTQPFRPNEALPAPSDPAERKKCGLFDNVKLTIEEINVLIGASPVNTAISKGRRRDGRGRISASPRYAKGYSLYIMAALLRKLWPPKYPSRMIEGHLFF